MLSSKVIVLGVTGSIAAYKAADLASKLTQAGARTDVIMTRAATEFVTPLTFRSLTHRPVVTDMFDPDSEYSVEHVALAKEANLVAIVPATANVIAKLASGMADDMLTTTVLATQAPVLLAPAMDAGMYDNPATQDNIARLKARGYTFVGPEAGRLASGLMGMGRLVSTEVIIDTIRWVLGKSGDLAGKRFLVSAGGTQEPFDPVRFIGNRSTGKMGYAVAEAARDRGAIVKLVSGPTNLPKPVGIELMPVRTALEMRDAVLGNAAWAEVLVMTSAVADYRPTTTMQSKIKKGAGAMTVELVANPDILAEVNGNFVKVGFAAESEDLLENAQEKLLKKNLDIIAANDITAPDSGFAVDTNRVILVDRQGNIERLPLMLKSEVADQLLDRIKKLLV